MEIKFQIFEKEQLLIQKFSGDFSIELYLIYTSNLRDNFALNSINKVLIDFREVEFDYALTGFQEKINRITEIRKSINKNEIKRVDVSHVFWVDKPLPTVIAQLFKNIFSELDYNYFTITDSIIRHLNLPETFYDLERVIENLDHTFKK